MVDVVTAQSEPAADEAARRDELRRVNSRWLATHAPEWYEPYVGRWIAASRGMVFIANDEATARGLALAAHPDDEPMLTHILKVYTYMGRKYVLSEQPPDPARIRRQRLVQANAIWLTDHGAWVFEQYRGQCVAISRQEVFAADTFKAARCLAKARHPDDEPFLQWIPRESRIRIYAS